jgi:hypothetical protein
LIGSGEGVIDKGQHIVNMNQCHHIVNTAS